jgi:hypothetical protein
MQSAGNPLVEKGEIMLYRRTVKQLALFSFPDWGFSVLLP